MPAFEREQILTSADLNWYLTVGGTLADQHEVGFQIWDIIDDPTGGTQVFPAVADTWEEVASTGKFSTGSYYTYDNAEARGWQVPADARIGSHRVKWRWKSTETSPYRYGQEDFSIVLDSGGVATYIEVSDVRAAGITNPPHSDEEVLAAIVLWQEFLDRACRQWFLPRQMTIEFDGDGSSTAHFGIPIISVESLYLNGSTTALDADLYEVYNERKNPKLALIHTAQITDIHVAPFSLGELRFYKGYKNQIITGTFGCVDANGQPPKLIQRALLLLVLEKLTHPPLDPDGEITEPSGQTFAGVVIEEKTDGHSIKYGTGKYAERRIGLSGITQNPEVLDIIRLYKAPIGIAMPSHWSYY